MQKALTQMNVQLANVISDLSGVTGQLIVRAIVGGERDPQKLAALRDRRIHASSEEVAKSLQGNWRPELLFLVKQEVDTYDTYQKRIAECDGQLQQQLASFASAASAVAAAPVTEPQADEQPKETRVNDPCRFSFIRKHDNLPEYQPRGGTQETPPWGAVDDVFRGFSPRLRWEGAVFRDLGCTGKRNVQNVRKQGGTP
jgi:hypothetical protein